MKRILFLLLSLAMASCAARTFEADHSAAKHPHWFSLDGRDLCEPYTPESADQANSWAQPDTVVECPEWEDFFDGTPLVGAWCHDLDWTGR